MVTSQFVSGAWSTLSATGQETSYVGVQDETTVGETPIAASINGTYSTGNLQAHSFARLIENQTEQFTLDENDAWVPTAALETGEVTLGTDWEYHSSTAYTTGTNLGDGTLAGVRTADEVAHSQLTLNLTYSGTGTGETGKVDTTGDTASGSYSRVLYTDSAGVPSLLEGTVQKSSSTSLSREATVHYALSGTTWTATDGTAGSSAQASSTSSSAGEGTWEDTIQSTGPGYVGFGLGSIPGDAYSQLWGLTSGFGHADGEVTRTILRSGELTESADSSSQSQSQTSSTLVNGQWVTTGSGSSSAESDSATLEKTVSGLITTGTWSDIYGTDTTAESSSTAINQSVVAHHQAGSDFTYGPLGENGEYGTGWSTTGTQNTGVAPGLTGGIDAGLGVGFEDFPAASIQAFVPQIDAVQFPSNAPVHRALPCRTDSLKLSE